MSEQKLTQSPSKNLPSLLSPAPKVRLVHAFEHPLDTAVAAARTCYASRMIYPEEVGATPETRAVRDRIAAETYAAGHHTTLQHAQFQFSIEQVSRQLVWSLLHAHPFYNSEQVSQRYVPVALNAMTVPGFGGISDLISLYKSAGSRAMTAYLRLTDMLMPAAEAAWFELFEARKAERGKWLGAIRKKAMECARYLLPVAAWTHLYHTVSGLTLHRYARTAELCDVPVEARLLIEAMVQAVREADGPESDFFRNLQDPVPLEETPEFRILSSLKNTEQGTESLDEIPCAEEVLAFRREFDAGFQSGQASCLLDYSARAESTLSSAVRAALGLSADALSDDDAICSALSPEKNSLLAQPLKLLTMDKVSRALSSVHYTFQKKLSHTADSQDQRHRTVPGARPRLARQYAIGHPDFITPTLINACPEAREFYEAELGLLFGAIDQLLERGASPSDALCLLPNAFPIRFVESGDLLGWHHKWTTRLCLTAQEEIWHASRDEVLAVRAVHPRIGKWISSPCVLRHLSSLMPTCPEGPRFCGQKTWTKALEDVQRVI